MADIANIIFTLYDLRVARWFPNNTYQQVSHSLSLASKLTFSVVADNDMIKSYGMGAELLSVITHLEGSIEQAHFDPPALFTMAGAVTTSSDTTPNAKEDTEFLAGGGGLPYFGAIGRFGSLNNGGVWVGLRKMKLDTIPGWNVDEQNKFKIAEVGFKAVVPDLSTRKLHKVRRLETDAAIPVDFNTFFS